MKKILLSAALLYVAVSCKQAQMLSIETLNSVEVAPASRVTAYYEIDTLHSSIFWSGFKPGLDHVGTIGLSHGVVQLDQNRVVGGLFTIDMNTIAVEDLSPDRAAKLSSHLKDSDFFEVDKYPTSTFELVEVSYGGSGPYPYTVLGNLTIKGITRAVSFGFDCIGRDSMMFVTTEPINLDRTKWNIIYKSTNFVKGLKDNFIYDNMQLRVTALFDLHAKKEEL